MLPGKVRVSLAGGWIMVALLVIAGLIMPWLPDSLVEKLLPTIEALILALLAAEGLLIIYDIRLSTLQHEEARGWHDEDMREWRKENGSNDK